MKRPLIGILVMLALSWGGLTALTSSGIAPRLGLDLQGGISVVLTAPDGTDTDKLEVAAQIIRRRIEEIGGVQEPDIAPSAGNALSPPNILVQLPGVTDEQRALEAVGTTGALTFRPVFGAVIGDVGPLAAGGTIPEGDLTRDDFAPCYAMPGAPEQGEGAAETDSETGLTVDDDATRETFLPYSGTVVHLGPAIVSGTDVRQSIAQYQNEWLVTLDFDFAGDDDRFACLTGVAARESGARRQIAIVLDGEVVTAPPVADTVGGIELDSERNYVGGGISGGSGVITLGIDQAAEREAQDLAVVLRYGSLPVDFILSDVSQVSGTLGADSLQVGLISGIAGLVLVAAFLLVFYRALGVVAIVGLTVFGSLLIGIYALFGEAAGLTLTLAGVTGIIVSVGITADSYIVYFERIKEEVRAGAAIRTSAIEGFRNAFRTILTADTVSLLGAGLLYALAVGPVKGFALSLGIATILDIIVARGFTRRAALLLAGGRLGDGGWFSIAGAAGNGAGR
jgi:protein-export membrane protein SecD